MWCPDILTVCLQPNHMKSLITLLASTSIDQTLASVLFGTVGKTKLINWAIRGCCVMREFGTYLSYAFIWLLCYNT